MRTIDLTFEEWASAPPRFGRGDHLVLRGGGHLRGRRIGPLRLASLTFMPTVSVVRAALPRWASRLRPGVHIPVFEECDFSGMRTRLEPWAARFVRCTFHDVRVEGTLMQAHFVDCVFSGEWHANFTAEADDLDPQRRTRVAGNDVRGLSGMSFFDGIPLEANRFDLGGRHLVVRRSDLDDPGVMAFLSGPQWGRNLVEFLHLNPEQDGSLLDRALLTDVEWERALDVLGPGRAR